MICYMCGDEAAEDAWNEGYRAGLKFSVSGDTTKNPYIIEPIKRADTPPIAPIVNDIVKETYTDILKQQLEQATDIFHVLFEEEDKENEESEEARIITFPIHRTRRSDEVQD